MSKRIVGGRSLASVLSVLLLVGVASLVLAKPKDHSERVVPIKVKRFEYSPLV
jgi:hypothetical protein